MTGWKRSLGIALQTVVYAVGLTGLAYLAGELVQDDATVAILLAFVLCVGWSFVFGLVVRGYEALWAPTLTALISIGATAATFDISSTDSGSAALYLSLAYQAVALGLLGAVVAAGVSIGRQEGRP